MRFIGQKASILAKMAVVLANTEFGEWIGTALYFMKQLAKMQA
jgi:hypothetical protein